MGPLASCRWDLKMMQQRWKSVEIPYERKYPVNVIVVTTSSVQSPVALWALVLLRGTSTCWGNLHVLLGTALLSSDKSWGRPDVLLCLRVPALEEPRGPGHPKGCDSTDLCLSVSELYGDSERQGLRPEAFSLQEVRICGKRSWDIS